MVWTRTGSIAPHVLSDARVQLHWAAQAVAGVGRTLNAPRADHSHTSFTWSDAHEALLQEPVDGITCGLRLHDLTVIMIDTTLRELPLRGRTLDEAFAFLESHFGKTLKRPDVDLPDHAVARGTRFDAEEEHLAELARYYGNAAHVLDEIARSNPKAGPVRCWPHHFDIATLITLSGRGEEAHEEAHTVGVGLSPGDGVSPEPYYYVTPWPYPDPSRLGELSAGRWNTVGWTGAVLPASSFAEAGQQEELVRTFLREAMTIASSA
jgi:hypothetical protein